MTDRELTERAANAAGVKGWWSDSRDYPSVQTANGDRYWNPLANDEDALALASILDFSVELEQDCVLIRTPTGESFRTAWSGDMAATLRRAIVDQAARHSRD